jgi:hypothetical protein
LGRFSRERRRVSASASRRPPPGGCQHNAVAQRLLRPLVHEQGRTSSTALVSGSQSEIARTSGGSCSRGNTPDKNIMGVSTSVK